MQSKVLVRSSVYYACNNWNTLIKTGVNSFLERENDYIKNYFVFLSNYRGDHIRLIFELNDHSQETVFSDLLMAYFNEFLSLNPSEEPIHSFIPGKSLWMDYPNNCIEIDNYETHFLVNEKSFLDFHLKLTYIINYLFAESLIREFEDIIDYSIYLTLKLLKLVPASLCIEYLDFAIGSIIRSSNLSIQKLLVDETCSEAEQAAPTNYPILVSYYTDMPESEIEDESERLMTKWISVCKDISDSTHNESIIINESMIKMIDQLNIQLGIGELSKVYILTILRSFFTIHLN